MRRIIILLIVIIAITGLTYNSVNKNAPSKRDLYEKFLLQKYKDVATKLDLGKDGKTKEEGGADFPEMASLQDYFSTLDPALGRVPLERLPLAYRQTLALQQATSMKSSNSIVQWSEKSSIMGGRTRAILWDPNDATHKKVWAGGVTGGLWYNNDITNANSQWTAVNDFWASLSISSIAYDPNNTQVMYCGTGEAQTAVIQYRESSGRGVGIFKSSNGGTSWTLLLSTQNFAYVTSVKVRNESGTSVIYAGVVSGQYHGAQQSLPSDGLYRSADGGTTWTQVLPLITGHTKPYAVSDVQLTADGRIFVGTMRNLDGDGGATILWSDLGTSGNWTKYENYVTVITGSSPFNLPGRVMIACAPSNANTLYALIAAGQPGGFEVYNGKYIIKSTNKGATWTQVNTPADYNGRNWCNLAWHAMDAAVDPNNPNTLYVGGLDVHKSTDGGMTYNILSDWSLMYQAGGNQYIHADQHTMVYKPGSSTEMVFGSDGGVFYTTAANTAQPVFMERNNHYSTLQFYSCDIDPSVGSVNLLGGLQDNGCLWYTGTPVGLNDMVSGGDGAMVFYDQNVPGLFVTSVYYNAYYIFNGGSMINYADTNTGIFINPADYDSHWHTLYCNACTFQGTYVDKLLRIKNVDATPLIEILPLNTGSTVYYSHVKVSPNSVLTNIHLFIGTQSGRLFKVMNAYNTPAVTEIGSGSFPTGSISCVSVGKSDDTLLVTFSNYGVAHVWQTYNGGTSWMDVSGNLPDMPVRWCMYHPGNIHQALLATETGVWSTSNLHQNPPFWMPVNQGLANVRTDMLKIRTSDKQMVAATHGRGLYTGTYNLDFSVGVSQIAGADLSVYPNPAHDRIRIKPANEQSPMDIRLVSVSGEMVRQKRMTPAQALAQGLNVESLPSGIYFIQINQGNQQLTQKIILY